MSLLQERRIPCVFDERNEADKNAYLIRQVAKRNKIPCDFGHTGILYKKIAFHTFFQLIARSVMTIANFIIILLIGKSLGSFGLGQYNKVFAFIGIFSLFVDFGINATFLKIGRDREVGGLIILRLFIAVGVFLIIQPVIFTLPYNEFLRTGFSLQEKKYIEMTSVILFIYAIIHSLNALLQKWERFDLYIWPNIAYGVSALSIAFYAFYTKQIVFFFIATIAGLIVSAFTVFIITAGRIFDARPSLLLPSLRLIQTLFLRSFPLGCTMFLNSVYVRVDIVLLSLFRTTSEVGVYSLAYKFFEFPLSISFFIMNALYPLFLKKHKENREDFHREVKTIAFILFLFSVCMYSATFFGAPAIGWIKNDFVDAIGPFRILILSYPIFFLSNLLLWVIITENREKILPVVYGISLVINGVFNVLFIPRFGYYASAVITVVSEFFVLVCFYWFVRYNTHYAKK